MFDELDEITKEIIKKYKPALTSIGVDFSQEKVQEAIIDCIVELESAFQTIITYWLWKKQNQEKFEHPNAFLIKAIQENWTPFVWEDEYLNNPHFKSTCQLWWEEAGKIWSQDVRNKLVADVTENDLGEAYILFVSGRTMPLRLAKLWGWERVLHYANSEYWLC
jgi:hypothetical protein